MRYTSFIYLRDILGIYNATWVYSFGFFTADYMSNLSLLLLIIFIRYQWGK